VKKAVLKNAPVGAFFFAEANWKVEVIKPNFSLY
jgi:hypothetical protein